VQCWGVGDHGQIGNGTTPLNQSTPAAVTATFGSADKLFAGSEHICVLASGAVWCWGDNQGGQLGDGTLQNRATPVQAVGLPGAATSLALGAYHSCALLADGTVWCWGENEYGQLGDGTTSQRIAPARVVDLADVTAITSGSQFTCALTQTGAMRCWGANNGGQLGDGLAPAGSTPRTALVACP
jgi:alpha-tubulin suppressor-like RCC1 family protein